MTEQTTGQQTQHLVYSRPDAEHVTLAKALVAAELELGRESLPLVVALSLHEPGRESAPEKLDAVARVLRAVVVTGPTVDNFVDDSGHVAIAGETQVDPADAAVLREVLGIDP